MTAARLAFRCSVLAVFASASASATPIVEHDVRAGETRVSFPRLARQLLAEAATLESEGQVIAALTVTRRALSAMETSASPDDALVALRLRVDELARAVPRVVLVGVLPLGATVAVDGVLQESARFVAVDPGAHEIVVEAPGRLSWRSSFRVDRGDAREIAIQPGPPLGFDVLPPSAREAFAERAAPSPFLHAPSTAPLRVAGDLRLAITRPIAVRATREPGGLRLCARETCGAPSVPTAGHDGRPDRTFLREVVAGTGVDVTTHAGMLMLSTSDRLAPGARFAAGMTSEKAVLALTGRW